MECAGIGDGLAANIVRAAEQAKRARVNWLIESLEKRLATAENCQLAARWCGQCRTKLSHSSSS
jgi:hypothetical protein